MASTAAATTLSTDEELRHTYNYVLETQWSPWSDDNMIIVVVMRNIDNQGKNMCIPVEYVDRLIATLRHAKAAAARLESAAAREFAQKP